MPPYVITDDELDRDLPRRSPRRWRSDERTGTTWLAEQADAATTAGLTRRLRPAARRPVVDLAGNDYLGLSRDPGRAAAAADAARLGRRRRGVAAGHRHPRPARRARGRSSPTTSGSPRRWCCRPATPPTSPWSPRWSTASALVISDAHIHASLVDAARLSRARLAVVPHSDVDAVRARARGRRRPAGAPGAGRVGLLGARRRGSADGAGRRVRDARRPARRRRGARRRRARSRAWCTGSGSPGSRTSSSPRPCRSRSAARAAPCSARRRCASTWSTRARPFIFDTALAPAAAAAALAALRVLRARPELSGAGPRPGRATWPTRSVWWRLTARCCRSRCRRRRRRSPRRPRPWRRASGWAASGPRRCPTASPACGSRRAPASPDADWARAVDVLVTVAKEHQ